MMKKLMIVVIGLMVSSMAIADIWPGDIENSDAYLSDDGIVSMSTNVQPSVGNSYDGVKTHTGLMDMVNKKNAEAYRAFDKTPFLNDDFEL